MGPLYGQTTNQSMVIVFCADDLPFVRTDGPSSWVTEGLVAS
jgi:hypothetical protein